MVLVAKITRSHIRSYCLTVTETSQYILKYKYVAKFHFCLSACWHTTPPQSRHPPEADTPQTRHPLGADPLEQTPPEQTPPEQTPRADTPPGPGSPGSRHPPDQTTSPPQSRHPPEQTPPGAEHSLEIRSTSGRYAYYWNAI